MKVVECLGINVKMFGDFSRCKFVAVICMSLSVYPYQTIDNKKLSFGTRLSTLFHIFVVMYSSLLLTFCVSVFYELSLKEPFWGILKKFFVTVLNLKS